MASMLVALIGTRLGSWVPIWRFEEPQVEICGLKDGVVEIELGQCSTQQPEQVESFSEDGKYPLSKGYRWARARHPQATQSVIVKLWAR
jgi:hypothetical protein